MNEDQQSTRTPNVPTEEKLIQKTTTSFTLKKRKKQCTTKGSDSDINLSEDSDQDQKDRDQSELVISDRDTSSRNKLSSISASDNNSQNNTDPIQKIIALRTLIAKHKPELNVKDLGLIQLMAERDDLIKKGIISINKKLTKKSKTTDTKPKTFESAYVAEKDKSITDKEEDLDIYYSPTITPDLENNKNTQYTFQDKMSFELPKNPDLIEDGAERPIRAEDEKTKITECLMKLLKEGFIQITKEAVIFGDAIIPTDASTKEQEPMETQEVGTQNNASYISPKKTTKLTNILKKQPTPKPTKSKNRFANLTIHTPPKIPTTPEEEDQIPKIKPKRKHSNTSTQNEITNKAKQTPATRADNLIKKVPCPPIVLSGTVENHKLFVSTLNKAIKKGFTIKYAPKTTLLYINDKSDY